MPQQMKFKTSVLKDKIRANRENHRAHFLKAFEGYKEDMIQELSRMLEEAKKGTPERRIPRATVLVEPMDMTKEYDRILQMLEMTTEEEIALSQAEFSQYVLDDWGWKEQVTLTNSRYIK